MKTNAFNLLVAFFTFDKAGETLLPVCISSIQLSFTVPYFITQYELQLRLSANASKPPNEHNS
jgi:hypothetical protein